MRLFKTLSDDEDDDDASSSPPPSHVPSSSFTGDGYDVVSSCKSTIGPRLPMRVFKVLNLIYHPGNNGDAFFVLLPQHQENGDWRNMDFHS